MLFANGLLTNEVLRWRLLGASIWQLCVLILTVLGWAAASWLLPLSRIIGDGQPSAWLTLGTLALAQAPAFAGHAAVVSTEEPRPLYLPRLSWSRAGMASVLLQKLAARLSTPVAAVRTASYLALLALSATLFLPLNVALPGTGGLGELPLSSRPPTPSHQPAPLHLRACLLPTAASRSRACLPLLQALPGQWSMAPGLR